ncbi:hypothetical protein H5410_036740 [Solanum commersonii]|uniref:Uncharacterized protein n=1 Tax=Solanum commersonii TaxID=4109 RepID=A0A9J5Y8A0_SOLCO|nr:hypothetical protein H5410_036740 [Solanum commersonii]
MDHRLWMYNMHYETGVDLKPEFIDGVIMVHLYRNGFKPRYFVWIDHRESDGLDDMFYNLMPVDVYNMVAPYGQIRVEHDRVHEMINDTFRVQGGMESDQYFDEALNEEARRFHDQLEESNRPLYEESPSFCLVSCSHIGRETGDFYSYYFGDDVSCRRNRPNRNDEGDIDLLFSPISIFNQNGQGSKKCFKRGFTDMQMQSTVTHILLNCPKIQPYVNLFVNTWGNEAIYTEFFKWMRNYMSSGDDGDRHREHLGVSQTKQAKKKKYRTLIDPEDIAGSISFAPKRISHDTYLFVVPFGTADPQQYYLNYRRPVGASSTSQALPSRRYEDLPLRAIHQARPLSACTPSPTGTSPQLSAMRIRDSSSEQSDAMDGTPPLTQRFVHPDVSLSSTATPSATLDDTMPAIAPG